MDNKRDLNSPLNIEDKWGGKLTRTMEDLRDFMNTTKLVYIRMKGLSYTWSN